MEILFACPGEFSHENTKAWRDITSREFYDGELRLDEASAKSVYLEKALGNPLSVMHIRGKVDIGYKRSWQHIRNNKVGLRVIWIIVKGLLKVSRGEKTISICPGEATIVDTNVPFDISLYCDENNEHETYQVVVPPDMFMTHLAHAENFTDSFNVGGEQGEAFHQLLNVLAKVGNAVNPKFGDTLAKCLLESVGHCIAGRFQRRTLLEKRLSDIENYIMLNLADTELSCEKTASKCGISSRYLFHILKENNTSFHELVWKNRLKKAHSCLISRDMKNCLVSEIAYISGYKSAPHFSRVFKSNYGCSPREYREKHFTDSSNDNISNVLSIKSAGH